MSLSDSSELLACALGDGYVNKSGFLSIRHSLAQKEYLEWKYNLLKKYTDVQPYFHENNGYGSYEFRTRVSKKLKFIRKILYPNGKKRITPKILEKVGLLGLAILYLDDGSLVDKKRNGKVHANDLTISLYVSYEEAEDIRKYLFHKYNLNFTLKKNKGLFSIRCGTKEARKFLSLIRPNIPHFKCFENSKLRFI